MAFITVEQLAAVFALEFPQLVRCKDYWVAHPVDRANTSVQIDHAWIVEWNAQDVPKPTDDDIQTLWAKHGPAVLNTEAAAAIRADRDQRLILADALIYKLEDLGPPEKIAAARTYRQALRDVPQQPGFPLDITWPEPPASA